MDSAFGETTTTREETQDNRVQDSLHSMSSWMKRVNNCGWRTGLSLSDFLKNLRLTESRDKKSRKNSSREEQTEETKSANLIAVPAKMMMTIIIIWRGATGRLLPLHTQYKHSCPVTHTREATKCTRSCLWTIRVASLARDSLLPKHKRYLSSRQWL